jgi:hypothetical protein
MIGSSLRPAVTGDFSFCQRLYFEEMAWIIDTLKLDMGKQRENFSVQWRLAEHHRCGRKCRLVADSFNRGLPFSRATLFDCALPKTGDWQ